MIGNTPVEELLEYVRAGSGMINLRDVEIQVSDTAWVSLQMPAAIKIEDKRLHLNIVQRQGESLPPEIEEILHDQKQRPFIPLLHESHPFRTCSTPECRYYRCRPPGSAPAPRH